MDRYPYLRIENKRLYSRDMQYTARDVIKHAPANQPFYLFDKDGITKNRPNYNTYQRLSSHADLWIDAGPRILEDLMDVVMAGATAVILRPSLWPAVNVDEILAITDCNLYAYYENPECVVPPKMNGLIIPYTQDPLPNRPLSLTQLPSYLLNMTGSNQNLDTTPFAGVFLDFSFFASTEHP